LSVWKGFLPGSSAFSAPVEREAAPRFCQLMPVFPSTTPQPNS
jgi:hypothetical protein